MVIATPAADSEWFSKIPRWVTLHPGWTLTLIVLVVLGPFVTKPFNIDDPLFIWAAQHIQGHPTNPYGFQVEWGWTEFPMWKVTENPPLVCYYLALVAGLIGWSEVALHTALLLPVLAAVLGTYRLARHFCSYPMLAALATLFTPVFLVSSLTVMCDMTMLAFWIWALVFWVEGTEQDRIGKLFLAAGLITLAELTKYYGACLIPLLAAYSVFCKRPVSRWGQCLLLPLAALLGYQLVTQALYGSSLLYNAMEYASFSKNLFGFSKAQTGLIAFAFTGGCAAVTTIFAPLLWRSRTLAGVVSISVVATVVIFMGEAFWKKYGAVPGPARMSVEIQTVVWVAGCLSLLLLAVADLRHRRDARSGMLVLWLLGTFAFVALFNWTVNARSVLPMIPAVGILIVRRLEMKGILNDGPWQRGVVFYLAASLTLALTVLQADYLAAVAVRQNAREVCADYRHRVETLWFQGHWGFQYYMSTAGGSALDFKHSVLKPGDALALPANNTNTRQLDPRAADLVEIYKLSGPWLLTTCDQRMGSGFYASVLGPLPFAFGSVPPEMVSVYVLKRLPTTAPN